MKLILLTLLGAAHAFLKGGGGGATCAADGGSSVYIETIDESGSVPVRRIQFSGCPNHESYCTGKPGRSCGDEGKTSTLVEGTEQCDEVEVPANPKLKRSQDVISKELDCTMGTIAYALNVRIRCQQLQTRKCDGSVHTGCRLFFWSRLVCPRRRLPAARRVGPRGRVDQL